MFRVKYNPNSGKMAQININGANRTTELEGVMLPLLWKVVN